MITKTIGVDGDFTDITFAWAYLITLGALANDYKFVQISNFLQNTGITDFSRVHLNGKTIQFLNPNNYIMTFTSPTSLSFFVLDFGVYTGILDINGLIFNQTVSQDIPFIVIGNANINHGFVSTIQKCKFIGNNSASGTGIELATWTTKVSISNCDFYNLKYTIIPPTTGSFNPGKNIENCTAYKCKYGFQIISNSNSTAVFYTIFKNCVSSKSVTEDFNNGSGDPTFIVISNCADSDNSIASTGAILSGNKTGITDADFLSVDPTSPNFLRIPSDRNLYAAGLVAGLLPDNIASIEGYPRPNIFGAVSIGAHEPNVAIDFAGNPRDPAIMDPVLFVSVINEATIPSYLWSLDDGKSSRDINPIDSYAAPGLKDISLVAQDSGGRFATVVKLNYIDVDPYKLGFTAVPMSGGCPLKVKFTSTFERQ